MVREYPEMHMVGLLRAVYHSINSPLVILSACLICLAGCRHVVHEDIRSPIAVTPSYSIETLRSQETPPPKWWQVFDDELLNKHIQQSLAGNFTLQQGYARLKQARLISRQAGSRLYPSITGGLKFDSAWRQNGEQIDISIAEVDLAWEMDLWGRLSSAAQSAGFDALAVEDELQGLALRLSIEVAEVYYQLIEQTLLLELLKEQIAANETSLGLIKLRFANGAASLVDVYQQKELVASVKAQLPLSEASLIVLQNKLHILSGQPPNNTTFSLADALPQIPLLPDLGIPADLLLNRPDLRQLQRELVASDYRVAEAVADRLPGLRIGSTAGFVNGDFLFSIFADALATILDWGYKKSEVEKRKAIVEEKLASYAQRYLLAIEEVENSLWQERKHERLLAALDDQLRISKATLHESRNRYVQGITDYLPVLAALVSQQNLERDILQRQRERLSYRLLLYRALGGSLLNFELHPVGGQR